MQLTHSFTIPAGLEEVWAHFQDISAVAECFPGAKVTSAEGDEFSGTAKVKLGPVALQYSGSGAFIERDESAHRMVFEAKGKDKRGNGTAGANVTLAFSAEGEAATKADVITDLSITGKPAQFGQRMMQEVSDKLLGQFVDCLQQQVGAPPAAEPVEAVADTGAKAGDAAAAVTGAPADDVAVEAAAAEGEAAAAAASAQGESEAPAEPRPTPSSQGAGAPATQAPTTSVPSVAPAAGAGAGPRTAVESTDDALDIGATVLPVIAKMYGKQIGAGLLVLLVLWLLRRRRS